MSRDYLSDKNTLVVSKPLAKALGVGPSIVLRRVQHWLDVNEHQGKEETHFNDGRWWAYNGYQKWTDDIEIYSKSTIKRLFTDLEKLHLLVSECKYNKRPGDRTKWYSIDYDAYDRFIDLWKSHRCPMYLDGKQSTEYKAFIKAWLDQWTTVGIPTVVPPIDHSSTTNRPQWTHQRTTVGPALPESPTDSSTKSPQSVEPVIEFPKHMVAFEKQNNSRTHPWVKAYAELLGKPYSASANEMKQLLEVQQVFTLDQFKKCTTEKLRQKPGAKLLFVLEDMPNILAALEAPKAKYTTMSPAEPPPDGLTILSPEEAAAILDQAKAKYTRKSETSDTEEVSA